MRKITLISKPRLISPYFCYCRKFTELTEKYRDLLDKSNSLVVHKETTAGYESEIKRLDSSNSELIAQLEIEKEKLHTLEAAFEHMRKQGRTPLHLEKRPTRVRCVKLHFLLFSLDVLVLKQNCCHIHTSGIFIADN